MSKGVKESNAVTIVDETWNRTGVWKSWQESTTVYAWEKLGRALKYEGQPHGPLGPYNRTFYYYYYFFQSNGRVRDWLNIHVDWALPPSSMLLVRRKEALGTRLAWQLVYCMWQLTWSVCASIWWKSRTGTQYRAGIPIWRSLCTEPKLHVTLLFTLNSTWLRKGL